MKDFKLDSGPSIQSGFKTPDGYFESFADRLMLKLPAQEVKVVPLYRRTPVWATSVAAAFILSLSLIFTQKETAAPTNLEPAAIENYLVYQADMSSYDLQQNLDQKDINDLEQSIVLSDEAVEEYLYSENIYLDE